MTAKLLTTALLSMILLPSCMHPVDQVLHARAEAKQTTLETTGRVSQGACDDIGQYIASNTGVDRLSMPNPTPSALLAIR